MARSPRTLCSGLRRILGVHDEPRMRTFVLRALAATNHVVETKEARRAIALMRSGNHFDVVVVTCVARTGRPRYGPRVGLIRNMFRQWPWIPVLVIARVQERARLIGAHHLLVSTLASLSAIAAEYDLPHFDKAFRQRTGMTPQEFRLRHSGRAPRRAASKVGRADWNAL